MKPPYPAGNAGAREVARNMADAVKYLSGVAEQAGLSAVSVALHAVRTSLILAAQSRDEPQQPPADRPCGTAKSLRPH